MEGRQDERHAELLAAIGKADQPDRLQQLNRDDLAAFLQQKRCMAAAAQVQRLNLNGFALASVVDGLGWNRSPSGDFLLARWLAERLSPGSVWRRRLLARAFRDLVALRSLGSVKEIEGKGLRIERE